MEHIAPEMNNQITQTYFSNIEYTHVLVYINTDYNANP